jgi:hypothetical protein
MADQQQNPGISSNTFSKGMLKDTNETFVGEGLYTHARNAVNNSHDGQVGVIGNEPSNLYCVKLPYTLIGCIHLTDDQWALFLTDNTNCEIGIFDESACTYVSILNDPCLGFKLDHLITGAFRKRYDCERIVYWDDGLNPTRSMDVDNTQQYHKYIDSYVNNCRVRTYLPAVDCETLRLAPLFTHPCISIRRGVLAGSMPNGSYQACIAYTVNEVKVTDYIGLTAVQPLWTHENVSSSLEITISNIDTSFDEFELVILSNVNAQTVAKRIGYYSTSQGTIYVDRWNTEYVNIPVGSVVFRSEPIEKTDAMYPTNNYLLRIGTYSKFKFNYQPIANNIKSKWVAVQYPADYYIKGNNNAGYMRDEVYSFFIRWVYNTGEFSESYHIPGRSSLPSDTAPITGDDAFETQLVPAIPRQTWQVQNTASITTTATQPLPDGGTIIAKGEMSYWESTERYSSTRLDIWGPLCGQPIRHHKMPDETISSTTPNPLSIFDNTGTTITILGVQFENIQPPVDNNGVAIPGIIGYEILRGSREGNKSIIAKGLFNNMRTFTTGTSSQGLFQNYPYNDLGSDPYLTAQGYKNDIFSFHGPDVTFSNPFLNEGEVKIYQEFGGTSNGYFEIPYKHPRMKILSNFLNTIAGILSAMSTIENAANIYKGAQISFPGTNEFPVDFQFVLPPFPQYPGSGGDVVPGSSAVILAAAGVLWGIQVALWVITAGFVLALIGLLGDAKAQRIMDVFTYLVPREQYAAQYNSHAFYNIYRANGIGNRRRKVLESAYGGNNVQQFAGNYLIQNIMRPKAVFIQLNKLIQPTTNDNSRFILNGGSLNSNFSKPVASFYGALKIPIATQYGQLEQIKQLPISTCITPVINTTTNVFFGGDVYINRFTEKNPMPFFTTWLVGQPDEYAFNYKFYYNIPDPVYWINNYEKKYGLFQAGPSSYYNLNDTQSNLYNVTHGWFYLFCNGVRDFFVESEVNAAYRDWEEDIPHRHYDDRRFADLSTMFRSDIVTSGNYYKYDYNLSISKLFGSHISWGNLLPRDYDPIKAATCYTYRPNRVIYSLPQQSGSKKDSWRAFLVNNYQDFPSRVSCIKPINKTGSLFMMANQSPMSFMGVEELKTDGTGAKITIGDGGLFQQPMQSVVNTDEAFEYGSNQGKYCSINTVYGVFWVSQNQGKVFNHTGQLGEISNNGLKWWFAKYLPSEVLKQYPTYALYDNPVVGVGVQMIYDNTYEIIYITKKDYKPKYTIAQGLLLDADNKTFKYNGVAVQLTDTNYFENASWTISYDPKSKAWISFHDWVPSFLIPGKAHFMSVAKTVGATQDTIWKHNIRCDSYCNYYNIDYPFEIEFVSATGQQVNSMRSIEYLLEAYRYHNDCRDKFHVLDENFDQAIIYNSEQVSGLLRLNIKAKNDPLAMLTYPRINTALGYIDIQFSKEENKYRFNQFWDIANNRGEYNPINLPMFNTEPNGYIYPINPSYINYSKDPLQHKKFRHNVNRVFLRRLKSDNNKFLFKISNQKLLQSPR